MYRQMPPGPPRVRNEPAGGAIILCIARWTACAHSEGAGRTFPSGEMWQNQPELHRSSTQVLSQGLQRASNGVTPWPVG
jgi:hypothetical protein